MAGRAGRLGYNETGKAIILTDTSIEQALLPGTTPFWIIFASQARSASLTSAMARCASMR